jgi:tetratricopeptide (TPR) repeat protein
VDSGNDKQMKNLTRILLMLILGACGQKSELSVENASRQVCDCFNAKTTGSFDDRLSPCMQETADKKNNEWQDAGITDQDSLKNRISKFGLEVMLKMTSTCGNYFIAMNDLYDKGYPIDTTELNRNAIRELSIRIKTANVDSVKSLLHKKVYKLIQATEFDLALQSIDSIKSMDNTDYDANLASAYIFNQTGLHDQAVIEIQKAIEVSGNENLELYAEVARQKKRTSKK